MGQLKYLITYYNYNSKYVKQAGATAPTPTPPRKCNQFCNVMVIVTDNYAVRK